MAGLSIRDLVQWMIPRMTMAGCNVTDIQGTFSRISSLEDWDNEWIATGKKYLDIGKQAERLGHVRTAYQMYFYSMIYSYEGQKVLFEDSERKERLYQQMLVLYRKMLEFAPYPVELCHVPWRDHRLPGYLHKPKGEGPFPCLIFTQGMDSSKEEWHIWGQYAVDRGFALFVVDTPGHGETRHLDKVHLKIPNVIEAVSVCRSYLQGRPDILPDKVGILGNCLGSNYAFQAAGFDPEFVCCLIILVIAEFKIKTSDDDVPKWFLDMIKYHTGDSAGEEGAFKRYVDDFSLNNMKRNVSCPTHLFHPTEDNWLEYEQANTMAARVDGEATITKVEGPPVFEGNAMSHLVPIYEQIHWVLPVAFDWVQRQFAMKS